jgi:hypothetical protein
MTTSDGNDALDALLARARLPIVSDEERARLAQIYAELQAQLDSLRPEDVRYREPAVIYRLEMEGGDQGLR